jgi:DNA polymerase-3 subunit delta
MGQAEAVVYVLYGDNEIGLKEGLARLRAGFGDPATVDLNTTTFDGAQVTPSDLRAASSAFPFLGTVRAVLIENATGSAGGRALIDKLADILPDLPDWARVIFVETGAGDEQEGPRPRALKKLVKLIGQDPRGQALAFEPPKDAAGWIATRAKDYRAAIEPEAARLLAERIGGDLRLADSEIAKLATYSGGARAITAADVELLTPYTAEANVFHMVDALGQRNGPVALRLLRKLLDDGEEPLVVFGMIVRQYRLLIQMKEHLASGGSAYSAASALGVRPFVADKLKVQCEPYSMGALERIYRHLLETDLAIKTGQMEPALALDVLVSRLAGRG